jgi:hypothetical protein
MEMLSKLAVRRPTPVVVSWAYLTANAIFVGAMLSTIAYWALGSSNTSAAVWTFSYVLLYSLIVAVVLVLVLLVHALTAGTIAFLKWPFVLFVLTYLVLSVNDMVSDRLTGRDTVQLYLQNESGESLTYLTVFGRGESARIDSIPAASGVAVSYRGRKNNDRARDGFSNRVGVSWVAGGRRRERILVGEAVGIGDSLIIVFPAPDSVLIADGRAPAIPK